MNSMIKKDYKIQNLHNDDQCKADDLQLKHGPTPAAVKIKIIFIVRAFGGKEYSKQMKKKVDSI